MSKKMKLKLGDLKVQSFVTSDESEKVIGGFTGDCLSVIHFTCPDPNCDFRSVPLNECTIGCNSQTCDPCSAAFTNCPDNGCGGGDFEPENKN